MKSGKTLSIVIPVYKSSATITDLVMQLISAIGPSEDLQIVLANDGSPDNCDELCRKLAIEHPNTLTYLKLAKNFGEHNAVMAGLNHARGEYTVIMDDDFQNPPAEVSRLVKFARDGDYDIVYSKFPKKHHHFIRNLGSSLQNAMASILLKKPQSLYLSSFKCLSRFVVSQIIEYRGPHPYIDGLALRSSNNIGVLEVEHKPRKTGESNYTISKLIRVWLNTFINFSILPLRIASILGLCFSMVGLALGVLVTIQKIMEPLTAIGWPSTMIAIMIFSGVQLLILGILGEYVGHLMLLSNRNPQFVIKDIIDQK